MEEIIRLKEIQRTWLASESDTDSVQAGAKDLTQFGAFAMIDALAHGDITRFETVLKQDIITVLTKLKYDKDVTDFQKRLHAIKQRNAKNDSRHSKGRRR